MIFLFLEIVVTKAQQMRQLSSYVIERGFERGFHVAVPIRLFSECLVIFTYTRHCSCQTHGAHGLDDSCNGTNVASREKGDG